MFYVFFLFHIIARLILDFDEKRKEEIKDESILTRSKKEKESKPVEEKLIGLHARRT